MRRALVILLALALAVAGAGCSKAKNAEKGEIAALQAQVKQLEDQARQLTEDARKQALSAAEEKRGLEEQLGARELRLIHQRLDAWQISPAATQESGWLLVDGERTYALQGHAKASKVRFYSMLAGDTKPLLVGEDVTAADGWTWKGAVETGHSRALWAEVEYPGGMVVTSPVLPIRTVGK